MGEKGAASLPEELDRRRNILGEMCRTLKIPNQFENL